MNDDLYLFSFTLDPLYLAMSAMLKLVCAYAWSEVMSTDQDCDWVVERCKEHLSKNNRSSAKAWILTARSLYPDNFAVQVGALFQE